MLTAVLTALLAACGASPPPDGPVLLDPPRVALPFATAGQTPPPQPLTVRCPEGCGQLAVAVRGPFGVDGDLSPVPAGASRTLTVRYTGAPDQPAHAFGSVELVAGTHAAGAELIAVVGAAGLGAATWRSEGGVQQAIVALPSAPFPHPSRAYADPSVLIALPDGGSSHSAVVHFHGHGTVLARTVADQRLVEQHAASGVDAVLVVPQGPVDASDNGFGRLDEPDGLATLLRDVAAVLYRDGLRAPQPLDDVVLTAHSGGYRALASCLGQGGVPVRAVHLFDAMYDQEDAFVAYARGGGVLRSVWTARGGTADENRRVRQRLLDAGLAVGDRFDADALASTPVTIGGTAADHGACIVEYDAYARWLRHAGLVGR